MSWRSGAGRIAGESSKNGPAAVHAIIAEGQWPARVTLKLITWNIQWGSGLDGKVDLARIVAHARAMADFDVLNLQEVADNFPGLEGNDDADQFAQLASLLPGYTAISGYGVDPAGPGRPRRFGNMILTRLPVVCGAAPRPAVARARGLPGCRRPSIITVLPRTMPFPFR